MLQLSRLLMVAMMATMLTACGGGNDPEADAEKAGLRLQRAEQYKQQGQFRAALIEARNALQSPAVADDARLMIAQIYNDLGQGKLADSELDAVTAPSLEKARAQYRALVLQRKYRSATEWLRSNESLFANHRSEYQLLLGKAQLKNAELDSARENLEQAARSSDTRLEARIALAELAIAAQQFDDAMQQLQAILQDQPEAIDALILKAALAYRQRDLDSAEDALSSALGQLPKTDIITPQRTAVLNNLILILTQQGRSAEALIYSRLIAEENPEGQQLREQFSRALELYRNDQIEEAEPLLLSLYEQTGSDSTGILLGMIYYSRGELEKARQYLGQHVDPEVSSEQAVKALAATQLTLNQAEDIIALLDRDDINPADSPDLAALLGAAQISAGKASAGVAKLTEVLDRFPGKLFPRIILARYYSQTRQFQQALDTLTAGLEQTEDRRLLRTELARINLEAGRFQDALTAAKQLIAENPEQASGYLLEGQAYWALNQLNEAINSLTQARTKAPADNQILFSLASVNLAANQAARAEALFAELISATPENEQAYKGFISSLELQGQRDSKRIADRVLAQNDNATAQAVMAEYYLRQQQLAPALAIVEELQPEAGSNRYVQSIISQVILVKAERQFSQRNFEQARETLLNALNNDPDNPRLNGLLVALELQTGRREEARKLLALLAEKAPDNPLTIELSGDLAMADGEVADASGRYQQAWQARPTDLVANKYYNSLLKLERNRDATAFLQQWRQTLPNSFQAITMAAVQAQQSGNDSQAITLYEQALAQSPDNVIALNNLAWLYHQQRNDKALATAEQAYQLGKEIPSVVDTYGWLLVENGKVREGVDILEQALALAPDNAEIRQHLEQARSRL